MQTQILGILNITRDSFSDGGDYFDPEAAIAKGLSLADEGAAIIDLGAESTHPDSENISVEEEIRRLSPVIVELKKNNLSLSVDTTKAKVMDAALSLGVDMINDISALNSEDSVDVLKSYDVPVVLMFSKNLSSDLSARADKRVWHSDNYLEEIINFFEDKVNYLVAKGFNEKNLILDPGMGFFLGSNPEPSFYVLKNLKRLKYLGMRVYISASRKSFIGSVLGKEVAKRAAASLSVEIWAALQDVDYIRTHDVASLHDALTMISTIQQIP